MLKALEDVKNGGHIRKISRKYGVPRATLQRLKKLGTVSNSQPHNKLLSPSEEESLVNYIKWMAASNYPIKNKVLKVTVQGILKKKRINFANKTPSSQWCQRFLKAHHLISKKAKQLEAGRIRSVNAQNFDKFFDLLHEVMVKNHIQLSPERIFNMDETGFSKQTNLQAPVIAPIGTKPHSRPIFTNDHITSVHSASASGQVLSPMIIFTKSIPRAIHDTEPKGWIYRSTNSGFINTDLFLQWFRDIFLKQIPKERPVILLLDAHSTHVTIEFANLAIQNQVEVISLPSKTSHILQPLDQIFGTLKESFASTAMNLKYVNGNIVTNQALFPNLLQVAMDKAWSPHVVKMAFQRTGTLRRYNL